MASAVDQAQERRAQESGFWEKQMSSRSPMMSPPFAERSE